LKKIALFGKGYWGSRIKNYIPEFFNLKYIINSKFDKNIIWNDKEIEAVIITTPIETHYEVAKEALEHNKNVYIEKPITLREDEALELVEIAQKNKLKIGVEYTQQFSKSILKMIELLPKIGELEFLEISTKHLGRFLKFNVYWLLASHHLSVLDMIIDISKLDFKFEDHIYNNSICTSGSILFDCGRIDVSTNYPGKEMYINLYGKNGTIKYNPLSTNTIEMTIYNKKYKALPKTLTEEFVTYSFDEKNNLRLSIKYFRDLLNGTEISNIDTAIKITKILEGC